MKNVFLSACVACLCASVAFSGERGRDAAGGRKSASLARDAGPKFTMLNDLLSAMDLSTNESNEVLPLNDRSQLELADEVERAKTAVRDRLIEGVRNVLSDEHKVQLDILVASLRKYEAAVNAATKQFNAKLDELGLSDLRGCRTEQDLIQAMLGKTDDGRGRLKVLWTKLEQAKSEALAKMPLPDRSNKEAARAYYEEKAKLEKAAESQALDEARGMLTDKQRASFDSAVEAQRKWAAAVQVALDAYHKEVAAVIPAKTRK